MMRNLVPLVLAGAMAFPSNVFAQELSIGDKMPVLRGNVNISGICSHNPEDTYFSYDISDAGDLDAGTKDILVKKTDGGSFVLRYNRGKGRIYFDDDGNGTINSIWDYSHSEESGIGPSYLCKDLEL